MAKLGLPGFSDIKYKGKSVKRDISAKTELMLLATTIEEYDQLKRDYPHMKIALDTSDSIQLKLPLGE